MTALSAPSWGVGVIGDISSASLQRAVMGTRESISRPISSDKLKAELIKAKEKLAEQEKELELSREADRQRELRAMMEEVVNDCLEPIEERLSRLEQIASGETSGESAVVPRHTDSQRLRGMAPGEPPMAWYERPAVHKGAATGAGGGGVVAIIWAIVELLSH